MKPSGYAPAVSESPLCGRDGQKASANGTILGPEGTLGEWVVYSLVLGWAGPFIVPCECA